MTTRELRFWVALAYALAVTGALALVYLIVIVALGKWPTDSVDKPRHSGQVLLVDESTQAVSRDRISLVISNPADLLRHTAMNLEPGMGTMAIRSCATNRWRVTSSGIAASAVGTVQWIPRWFGAAGTIAPMGNTVTIRLTPRCGEVITLHGFTTETECQDGRILYILNAGEVCP